LENLLADARFALRQLVRHPTFTAIAVGSLAVAIGSNVAVASLVEALLLRPLPVANPDRLVAIATTQGDPAQPWPISLPNFEDLRERSSSYASMAVQTNVPLTVRRQGAAEAEKARGQMVSASYFETLGVKAAAGRTFMTADGDREGSEPGVVLGHGYWQRRFHGDPAVVGSTLLVAGRPMRVIGIAAAGFRGTLATYSPDLFVPLAAWRQVLAGSLREGLPRRGFGLFAVAARLRPGVTMAAAQAETTAVVARLVADYPVDDKEMGAQVTPLDQVRLRPKMRRQLVLGSAFLLAGSALVLLVACVNLSGLLMGRLVERQREMAVRRAVGGREARLTRMLLTEALVLAISGSALGLVAAVGIRRMAWSLRPPQLPEQLDAGVEPRLLVFVVGLTLLTALLFGVAPALSGRRQDLAEVLRNRTSRDSRVWRGVRWNVRAILVGGQVALAVVSLVLASLFLRALADAHRVDVGFARENLLLVALDPSSAGLDEARAQQLYDRAVTRLSSLPGVASAALGEAPNLAGGGYLLSEIRARGASTDDTHVVQVNTVAPGYLATMRIPLRQGRDVAAIDRPDTPSVAVVNETMARELWPGESPVGRHFSVVSTGEDLEVVGGAADAKYRTIDEEPIPYFYRPLAQHFASPAFLLVRTRVKPETLAGPVRAAIRAIEPALAVDDVRTMTAAIGQSLWAQRFAAVLLAAFGGASLLLSMIGLYGALSFSLRRRQQEIGLRLALGARRRSLVAQLVAQGMRLAGIGLAVGLAAALALGGVALRSLHAGALDLWSFAGAAVLLLVASLLTNIVLARRAAAMQPLVALRAEA
jgi:predicted permease